MNTRSRYDPENGLFTQEYLQANHASIFQDQQAGVVIRKNALPPGFIVVHDYLNNEQCRLILQYAASTPGEPLMVGRKAQPESTTKLDPGHAERRVTEGIPITGIEKKLLAQFNEIFLNWVEPHFQVEIDWYEKPYIMRYTPGGKYEYHSDSEIWNQSSGQWERIVDRDISILLYVGDRFEGGDVVFPTCGLRVKPKPGMLLAFPSDHRYLHTAEQVTSGLRCVIVSWAAVKGSPRIMGTSPEVIYPSRT